MGSNHTSAQGQQIHSKIKKLSHEEAIDYLYCGIPSGHHIAKGTVQEKNYRKLMNKRKALRRALRAKK